MARLLTRLLALLLAIAAFSVVAMLFFLAIGKAPLEMLQSMVLFAVGDSYSLSETLVKTAPILLCALAIIVPARLGLISVGADGQLYFGALLGTAVVLAAVDSGPDLFLSSWLLLPAMLVGAAAGGALWGAIAGLLRARLAVNETITTLLLNYIAVLLVNHFVYGAWKDPANLGWPATIEFPTGAQVPHLFGTRAHAGLLFAVVAALLLQIILSYSRWGLSLRVLRGNPGLAGLAGLRYARQVIIVMALAGALAGIAGICEVSAIQGRLQPGISLGYGLSGFLVAWLAAQSPLLAIPVSFAIGGLLAAGDALQLFAKVPAASAVILQGLLFVTALAVGGLQQQIRSTRWTR
jgi:simple sugar transport system permease protein